MKRFLSVLIALVLTMALMASSSAEPNISDSAPGAYYVSQGDDPGFRIDVGDLKEEEAVTNLKISDPDIIALDYITLNNLDLYFPMGTSLLPTGTSRGAILGFRTTGKKTGTCKISFKAGAKKYTKKVIVYPYQNPIRKLTYTPAGSGSFHKRFQNSSRAELNLAKAVGSGTLKVVSKEGWKVRSLTLTEKGEAASSRSMSYTEGVSSARLLMPKLKKKHTYVIQMEFQNSKTKGILYNTWTVNVGA